MADQRRITLLVIVIAAMSMGVIALVSAGSWYANSDHGRTLLLKKLNTVIPGKVTVADHHLSLYKGSLSLREMTVRDPQGEDIVFIAGIDIDVSPAALFRKTVVV